MPRLGIGDRPITDHDQHRAVRLAVIGTFGVIALAGIIGAVLIFNGPIIIDANVDAGATPN